MFKFYLKCLIYMQIISWPTFLVQFLVPAHLTPAKRDKSILGDVHWTVATHNLIIGHKISMLQHVCGRL